MNENTYKKFLSECEGPVAAYVRRKKQLEDEEINPFKLVSDFYYRETYHTDILLELLNPKGSHKEGNLFLDLFIEALNNTDKMADSDRKINLEDYVDANVDAEGWGNAESKMDIVIVSKDKPRCIIIENKLNNADDMERQIPRYYDMMHDERNLEVDGIVYIPLDGMKRPDEEGWLQKDKDNVHKLTCILSARLLVDKWLSPCLKEAKRRNATAIIIFYIELLESLIMEDKSIGGLYKVLCEGDNASTLQELIELQKKLPNYMARSIKESFQKEYEPFKKVDLYPPKGLYDCLFEDCFLNGSHLKLDVVCSLEGFELVLWDLNDKRNIKEILGEDDSSKIENLNLNERKFKIATDPVEMHDRRNCSFYRLELPITEFKNVIGLIKNLLNILKNAQKKENK